MSEKQDSDEPARAFDGPEGVRAAGLATPKPDGSLAGKPGPSGVTAEIEAWIARYRGYADEARRKADQVTDAPERARLLRLADTWDQLADFEERDS
jgi:hypothetical protein